MITIQYQVQTLTKDFRKWEGWRLWDTLKGARKSERTFRKWSKTRIIKITALSMRKIIDD